MEGYSEKLYLKLSPPTEDDRMSDRRRILQALRERGCHNPRMPLHVLGTLYPMCRDCGYEITVSVVWSEDGWTVTSVEPGDTRQCHYGLAVDYGSTTIVMELVDMNTGETIARDTEPNGQIAYGTDILTRITYALESDDHKSDLQQVTAATFDRLIDRLSEKTGVKVRSLPVMIVSGNTTMIHFLLKLDAWTVFASPYAPVTTDPGLIWGREVGIGFDGLLSIIPAASNYIGGDIISGLLTLDIHNRDETSLFFDIGTNGELVIGNREWMLAGAGAAGPALEGYISKNGMRAAVGAIDRVKIDGRDLKFTTIGEAAPVGICGSGIIDLLAQMRLNGWINIAGELNPAASDRIVYLEDEGQLAAVYATAVESGTGEPLVFTQTDIRQYLDTKAAAVTMVECLLDAAGCTEGDLDRILLSGAFTAHSDLESAITIGMFPDLPRERYTCIKNTSLDGARLLLLDRSRMGEARDLAENMYCVQFASVPDFLIRMQAAKFIPHTDMNRYPTVRARLGE